MPPLRSTKAARSWRATKARTSASFTAAPQAGAAGQALDILGAPQQAAQLVVHAPGRRAVVGYPFVESARAAREVVDGAREAAVAVDPVIPVLRPVGRML